MEIPREQSTFHTYIEHTSILRIWPPHHRLTLSQLRSPGGVVSKCMMGSRKESIRCIMNGAVFTQQISKSESAVIKFSLT